MSKQKSILSFWKDIEIFSLPDLPSNVKSLDLGKPLPWELPYAPRQNSTWRHILFLGRHTKERIIDVIEKALGDNSEKPDWQEKPAGNTCMAVLILNERGQLSGDSPYLQASYLHGIKCLQEGKNLSEVTRLLNEVQEKFRERHAFNQEAEDLEEVFLPVISPAHLKNEIAVLNSLGLGDVTCDNHIYIQSVQVSKQSKSDTAFLNSFYLNDLHHLISNASSFGKGLDAYLRADTRKLARTDLLADSDAFFQAIDPAKIPAGRWPSNPAHGLYAAQLGAVSTSLGLLKDSGLMGINGPPGTGKTTLLSDIVAEVVVLRAQKLIKGNISSLFSKGNRIEKENSFAYHFPTDSDVFDNAGIVVASNNNAAVENISKELPDERKIDRETFAGAKYFPDFCQNLIEGKSWGLIAAALGNSENRSAFKNNFWYKNDSGPGFAAFLQSLYNNPEKEDYTYDYLEKYEEAKAELKALLKDFNEFKKVAAEFYQLLPDYLNDQRLKAEIAQDIDELTKLIKSSGLKGNHSSKSWPMSSIALATFSIVSRPVSPQSHGFSFFRNCSIQKPIKGGTIPTCFLSMNTPNSLLKSLQFKKSWTA